MRNHRKMIRAGKKTWNHMVPANTLGVLEVPVKRTEITLEIGSTISLKFVRQKRPVTPESFKNSQHAEMSRLSEMFERPWEGRKQA
jgi:hypothetical protein